jgi:hypothetical protein
MLKRYRFWLWVTVVLQLLTATVHSISLFVTPTTNDQVEQQMLSLMMGHRMEMGAGFHPTMYNLFIALSACFTFLCLLGAFSNIVLLRRNVEVGVVRGLIGAQLLIFAIAFAVMARLTFLHPIVSVGLIVVALLITFLTARNTSSDA